ncbi:MAG: DnaA/Hda family protein [Hyphomicrobiales bacterium]
MSIPLSPRQLAFSLGHAVSFAREDFLSGPSNAAALKLIERWPDWPDKVIVLVGPEGSGKSHLAAIWAEMSGARFLAARALTDADPLRVLATGALVVEDLAPENLDERALFHLLNLAREEGAFMLVTARSTPAGWPAAIRDLTSRLRALLAVKLDAPDDALLRALIVKLAADRQLTIDETLLNYLVTRIERSFAAARVAVAELDAEAMRQKRPVTRALASELWREGRA